MRLDALPGCVGPFKGARIDDLGRTMWPVGLKSRRRIGQRRLLSVETIAIEGAGPGLLDGAGEVATWFARQLERSTRAVLEHHFHFAGPGRADAKMRAAFDQHLSSDGKRAFPGPGFPVFGRILFYISSRHVNSPKQLKL